MLSFLVCILFLPECFDGTKNTWPKAEKNERMTQSKLNLGNLIVYEESSTLVKKFILLDLKARQSGITQNP